MSRKILIFGGSGFIGGNMTVTAQKRGWKVYIADSFYRSGLNDVEWKMVNIADEEAVCKAIEEITPNAVVNVAAVSDIDKAEQEREMAWDVNVNGARYIAASCAKWGVRYIFFSSDAVFDGNGSLFTEEDEPDPVNFYGKTKAEAEKAVLAACPNAAVIRISLVIGFPVTGGNSFFAAIESKLKEGKEILCPIDEIRTPVDVLTLSECVLELAENDFSGILHIGATNSINRYELTKRAAAMMGLDANLVKNQTLRDEKSNRAPRHKNGIIGVSKAQSVLKTKLLSIDEGIERAVTGRI